MLFSPSLGTHQFFVLFFLCLGEHACLLLPLFSRSHTLLPITFFCNLDYHKFAPQRSCTADPATRVPCLLSPSPALLCFRFFLCAALHRRCCPFLFCSFLFSDPRMSTRVCGLEQGEVEHGSSVLAPWTPTFMPYPSVSSAACVCAPTACGQQHRQQLGRSSAFREPLTS